MCVPAGFGDLIDILEADQEQMGFSNFTEETIRTKILIKAFFFFFLNVSRHVWRGSLRLMKVDNHFMVSLSAHLKVFWLNMMESRVWTIIQFKLIFPFFSWWFCCHTNTSHFEKVFLCFCPRPWTERPDRGDGAKPSLFTVHSTLSHGIPACVEGELTFDPCH